MLMTSGDNGRTWSKPARLPDGDVGPVRNKPVSWPDGSLLCGASTEDHGWQVHMERTPDLGATWERTPPLNDGKDPGLIQPTILKWPSGRTQILCRSRQKAVYSSWMGGDWRRWNQPEPTVLPNPNSAIDAVILKDGRALLVYNHTTNARSPLNVAVSAAAGVAALTSAISGLRGHPVALSLGLVALITIANLRGVKESGRLFAGPVYGYVVAMLLLTRTPLGRMANASRDNFERAQFVGYDPRMVRFFQFALSGAFAGIAGALYTLTYEIVTYDTVAGPMSANALLMTYIGGVGVFAGWIEQGGKREAAQSFDKPLVFGAKAPVAPPGTINPSPLGGLRPEQ
jgi:hypothetical protein